MSHLLFIFVCVIWGLSFLLMKWSMASFGPIGVGAMRVIFGTGALAIAWKASGRRSPLIKRDILPMIGLAVVGYCAPYTLQPLVVRGVEKYGGHGSAFGGMMLSFVPLLTILVSIPMLKVYPTRRQLLGVGGGGACMWALFAGELRDGVPLRYLLLGAITPICYAFGNTYVKRRFNGMSATFVTIAALGITAVVLTPPMFVFEGVKLNKDLPMSLGCLFILGVLCTGIATSLFYKLVQGHGPLYAGMVSYIIPCVAIGVGWLDGETINRTQLLAMAGIFAMVALVQWRAPKPEEFRPEISE